MRQDNHQNDHDQWHVKKSQAKSAFWRRSTGPSHRNMKLCDVRTVPQPEHSEEETACKYIEIQTKSRKDPPNTWVFPNTSSIVYERSFVSFSCAKCCSYAQMQTKMQKTLTRSSSLPLSILIFGLTADLVRYGTFRLNVHWAGGFFLKGVPSAMTLHIKPIQSRPRIPSAYQSLNTPFTFIMDEPVRNSALTISPEEGLLRMSWRRSLSTHLSKHGQAPGPFSISCGRW